MLLRSRPSRLAGIEQAAGGGGGGACVRVALGGLVVVWGSVVVRVDPCVDPCVAPGARPVADGDAGGKDAVGKEDGGTGEAVVDAVTVGSGEAVSPGVAGDPEQAVSAIVTAASQATRLRTMQKVYEAEPTPGLNQQCLRRLARKAVNQPQPRRG